MSRFSCFSQRKLSMEGLESRDLMAANVIQADVPGHPVETQGYDNGKWFVADSFSFGVEREMKESGEKGGTADINIGVGELQECTISKSMDMVSMNLAQFAINGNSLGPAEIHFAEVAGSDDAAAAGKPVCYLKYKLDRAFVKSWSTSGDADERPTEEVAFYYNKIALNHASTKDGKEFGTQPQLKWDNVANKMWDARINRIELVSDSDPATPDYIELEIVADPWVFNHDTAGTIAPHSSWPAR